MPEAAVGNWLDRQPRESIWTTSITVMELRFGLYKMPTGRKQTALIKAVARQLEERIEGRVAVFDATAAEQAAERMAMRKRRGGPVELRDTMIAGIAAATRATLAIRHTGHFAELSVPVVNPWTA